MSYTAMEISKMMYAARTRQDVLDILDGCQIEINSPGLCNFLGQTHISDEAVMLLIERKSDINVRAMMDNTPLHVYADILTVRRRTSDRAAGSDEKYGDSPFKGYDHAVHRIKMLVDANANVNMANCMGHTPLFRTNTIEGVQTLLECKSNVLHRDREGRTPLQYYKSYNKYTPDENEYKEICRLLKQAEKDQKKNPADPVLVKETKEQYNGGDKCCSII